MPHEQIQILSVQNDVIATRCPRKKNTMKRFPTTLSRTSIRRTLASTAAVALLATTAACGGSSADDQAASGTDKVNFGVFPVFVSLPVWVARDKGFFDDNKLKVDIKTITSGPAIVSALASNSVDAVVTGQTGVETARSTGMPIKMVSVTLPTSIYHMIGSPAIMKDCKYVGQPYPEPMRCAKGKKIGIIGGLGTESHTVGLSLLSAVGLKEKDVTFVPIGGGEGGGNSLKEGLIDIQLAEDTAAAFTEQLQAGESLMDIKTQGDFASWVGSAAWAMEPNLKKSPEKFQRIADSLDQAVAWIADPANEAEAVEIFAKYSPTINKETIAKVLQNTRKSWGSEASCDQVMNVVNWLVENGTVPKAKADTACTDLVWETAHVK